MTCDLCGEREATVHLTEIIQDESRELHLCEPCAREKGVKMDAPFGLADLMTGLTDLGATLEQSGIAPPTACPQCGMRFEDFKRSGRLGCGTCYETFQRGLALLLRQVHGASRHIGKAPAATSPQAKREAELEGLKARLKQAVKSEAFEEAATLRDRIGQLEPPPKPKGTRRGTRHRSAQ